MAGLQRSVVSFRRQGSSGLVWDDKLLSGELNHPHDQKDNKTQRLISKGSGGGGDSSRPAGLTIQRSRSDGGYRTGRVSPAIDPPSPRVSACGVCCCFGRDNETRRRPPKHGKRVV